MTKNIIFSLLLISIMFFFTVYLKDRNKKVTQIFSNDKFSLVLKYSQDFIIKQNSYKNSYDLGDFITFNLSDNEFYEIKLSYRIENNGDDTPSGVSETGAAPFPPQPQELVYSLTDEYEKVGEWLEYNLYIEKEIKQFGYIYQEVFPNQLTEQMTLLSDDKARVNYYDRFIISYNFSEQESLEKQRKEFLKILKSMEITEIEN